MPCESHDWSVPAPLRALLWWPPVALVLAVYEPAAAAGSIAASGAVLALLGLLVSMVARSTAGRSDHGSASVTALHGDAVTAVAVERPAA